jgi:Spy/CpxP family protein refolding chaperone
MLGMTAALGLGLATWTAAHAEDGGSKPQGGEKKVLAGPKADADQKGPGARGFDGKGGPGGPHGPIMDALRDLNLSEEQKTKVREIMAEFKQKVTAHREAHGEEINKLKQEAQAAREAGDKDKLRDLAQQRAKIMEGAPKPTELVTQIKGVLTPDQAKTFDAAVEDAREKMQERRGDKMGPGGPGHGEKGEKKHGEGRPPKPEGAKNSGEKQLDL